MILAATWYRVSTGEQETSNQVPETESFCEHHGYEIAARYEVAESAWDGGSDEYRAALEQMLTDAWRGRFRVLVVWSLDRLTRGGVEDALRLIRKLRERHVALVSVQEPWLNGSAEVTDLLVAFAAWMAQQESARRSARIRAGLARRKAAGLPTGRQAGARDRRPRKTAGYLGNRNRSRAG